MDFLSLAKSGLDAYNKSQGDVSTTGGSHLNQSSSRRSPSPSNPEIDNDSAIASASKHSGTSGGSDIFSSALSFLSASSSAKKEPLDEAAVLKTHQKVYDENNTQGVDAKSMGSAAALQVLKNFTSSKDSKVGTPTDSGNFQTKLVGLAMAEAAKMFDSKGGAAQGNKQDAVNGAAETIIKLLIQSKFSGGTAGGSNSGGLGQLLSLASQFAK